MPAERRREVLVEAGHRCAIPTCKQIPVEVHHINGSRDNHAFSNLIALCRNCHARADNGEIDRASLRIYKANLGVLVSRYGDLERRVLDEFVHSPDAQFIVLPRQLEILMSYLVRDEMVECSYPPNALSCVQHLWETRRYDLTDAGRALVESLREGRAIEP
jgi:hypothetical protein